MRALVLLAATGLFVAVASTAGHGQAAPAAKPGALLPPGEGHDLTLRVCSGCHTPDIAAQQQHDRKGWADLVQLMANNGAQATDAELEQITDYLARSFPPPKS